jgi:nucleoside-diphosphate-sugar epimerase
MAKYLVTGGAGFIGGHLAQELVRRGHEVRILDDFSTGKRENLATDAELIHGDLRDSTIIAKAVRGVDGIFHEAAVASVPRSIREPAVTNEVNVSGTLNLLVATRDARVRRLVMASSSSVYGNSATLPKVETMPLEPLSPYALQKAAGELYVRLFFPLYGLETIALRYFNVFGPRQDPESEYAAVIPRFITSMLHGNAPTIYGDGEQSRDFIYVDNAVAANIAAMEASVAACGQTYNIACGERFTLNEVVQRINKLIGTSIRPLYEPERAGDVKHSLADISAARKNLGFSPAISFQEGLRRTVEWFKGAAA